jgi:hypothetical protein
MIVKFETKAALRKPASSNELYKISWYIENF